MKSITKNHQRIAPSDFETLILIESRIFASVSERVLPFFFSCKIRSRFDFAHMQKSFSRNLLFLEKPRSDEINCEMFYLSAGYWTVGARVDDITIVFIGRVFVQTLFRCYDENDEKNHPKWSWHHMVYGCLLERFICHQHNGLDACVLKMKSLAIANLAHCYQFIDFPLAVFYYFISTVSSDDSVDNPYSLWTIKFVSREP